MQTILSACHRGFAHIVLLKLWTEHIPLRLVLSLRLKLCMLAIFLPSISEFVGFAFLELYRICISFSE